MIDKKLIHFNKRETFDTELENGNIPDTSIVFIKDTQEIWTHGQIYKSDTVPIIHIILTKGTPSSITYNQMKWEKDGYHVQINYTYNKLVEIITSGKPYNITLDYHTTPDSFDPIYTASAIKVSYAGYSSIKTDLIQILFNNPVMGEFYDENIKNKLIAIKIDNGIYNKVTFYDPVTATQQKDGLMSSADKTKLDSIAAGAEVNVQSDWNVTDTASDAFIKNKPTSMPASDVPAWAKAATKPTYTKAEVGLSNVDNTSDANKPISTATQTALNNKVDKVTGKGLSSNDYTTAEKDKLAGIEAQANKYILPTATKTGLGGIKLGDRLDAEGTKVIATSLNSDTALHPVRTFVSNALGELPDRKEAYIVLGTYNNGSTLISGDYVYGTIRITRGASYQLPTLVDIDILFTSQYNQNCIYYDFVGKTGGSGGTTNLDSVIKGIYKITINTFDYVAIQIAPQSSSQVSFIGVCSNNMSVVSADDVTAASIIDLGYEPNNKKRFENSILEKVAAGQTMENIMSYGVEWDTTVADPHITRIGNMSLHKSLPIQSGMKRLYS